MRLSATESERRLQEEVREFLAGAALDASSLPHVLDERIEALRGWQARCYAAGYVGRAWPREFGGGGAPAAEQVVIQQGAAGGGGRASLVGQRGGVGRARAVAAALRRRRAAPALHPADPVGRRDLVPGLL